MVTETCALVRWGLPCSGSSRSFPSLVARDPPHSCTTARDLLRGLGLEVWLGEIDGRVELVTAFWQVPALGETQGKKVRNKPAD